MHPREPACELRGRGHIAFGGSAHAKLGHRGAPPGVAAGGALAGPVLGAGVRSVTLTSPRGNPATVTLPSASATSGSERPAGVVTSATGAAPLGGGSTRIQAPLSALGGGA